MMSLAGLITSGFLMDGLITSGFLMDEFIETT
jgi:hypothetical protein